MDLVISLHYFRMDVDEKTYKMHATCNPKEITALTEDYKALMLRKLMIQTRISIAPSALTELDVTGHDKKAGLD